MFLHHKFTQNGIHCTLILGVILLEPIKNVCINTQSDRLFDRPVEFANSKITEINNFRNI